MTRAQFQQFQKRRLQNVLIRQKGPWRLFGQYWIEARRADLQTMDTALWQGRRTLSQYHNITISHARDGCNNFMISCSVLIFISLWYIVRLKRPTVVRKLLYCFRFTFSLSWKCCFLIWWFFDLLISWFKDFIPAVDGRPGWMSMTTLFVPVFMQHITPKILPSHIFYPYKSFLGRNHQKHS